MKNNGHGHGYKEDGHKENDGNDYCDGETDERNLSDFEQSDSKGEDLFDTRVEMNMVEKVSGWVKGKGKGFSDGKIIGT